MDPHEDAKVFKALADENREEICGETLAVALSSALDPIAKEWDINGEKVTLSVAVVNA